MQPTVRPASTPISSGNAQPSHRSFATRWVAIITSETGTLIQARCLSQAQETGALHV